jgi:hypothetical protein
MVRIIVCFQLRGNWSVQGILEDARTAISPWVYVTSQPALIKLFRYIGATDDEIAQVEDDIRRWSRGSVHITLVPGRENLLRIRAPWNEGLLPPR